MSTINLDRLELFPELPPTPTPTPTTIRAHKRAADWRAQMARAFRYVHGRAQSEEEAAELEAQYEAALADGPDFLRYRGKSEFMDAPEITLDRNGRTQLWIQFYTMTRNAWREKARGRHRGALLSRTAEDTFKAFMYLAERFGRVFPSIVGLAYLARCCPKSVSTALNDLEALGFLTRHRRLKRVMTPLGFRVEQISNAYEVHAPCTALGRLAVAMFGKPTNTSERNFSLASESLPLTLDSNHQPEGQQGGLARVARAKMMPPVG